MSLHRYLLVSFVLLAAAPTALAQPTQPLSQQHRAEVLAVNDVDVIQLPEVDNEALLDRDEARMSFGQPEALQFAEPFDLTITPASHGTWEELAGHRVWRLVVRSPGAFSLNAGFGRFELPPGAALWLYAAGEAPGFRAFTAADHQEHGQLWTPIVPSETMVIELNLPGTQHVDDFELEVARLSHAYRPFGIPGGDLAVGRNSSCHVDVACPEGDGFRDVIRSVATYSRGGSRVCSAVAVNNTAMDGTPLILSADHCGLSPVNAPSMVVYWNYENSYCRPPNTPAAGGPGDGSLAQFSTGATYRVGHATSDYALVELNEELDVEFEVFLAGWDRRDQATSSGTGIHHPNTLEKRISLANSATAITNYGSHSPTPTGTHIRVASWDAGTVQHGSSGSPFFSPEKRVVGQLHGGFPGGCAFQPVYYGRVFTSMNLGLAQWLDPGSTGLEYIDGLEGGVVLPELPEAAGGTSRAMAFGGSASLSAGPSPFFPREDDLSISLWAQVDGPGTLAELVSDEGVAFRFEVVEQDGEHLLRYLHEDADGNQVARTFTQRALTDGRYHIALTRGDEPAAVRVFLDGQRVGQPFFYSAGPPSSNQRKLHIGNTAARNAGFTGLLDEVRLFRERVLLEALRPGMHASFSLDEMPPELIAYYRFEADTTGFAYDFSNHGSSGEIEGDLRVASPFPVGEEGVLLSSPAVPSGTAGPEGLRITAAATSPLGGGNQLGVYANPVSNEVIEGDDVPDYVVWRSRTVWGAFGYGEVTANLTIDFDDLAQQVDAPNFRLLHRTHAGAEWADVTEAWTADQTSFSIAATDLFGEWAVGYSPGVGTGDAPALADAYRLEAAFPNPFSSAATMRLAVGEAQDVRAELYDALGRRVQVIFDGTLSAGTEHSLTLDGAQLPSGMYVVRVTGENFTTTAKVMVVR